MKTNRSHIQANRILRVRGERIRPRNNKKNKGADPDYKKKSIFWSGQILRRSNINPYKIGRWETADMKKNRAQTQANRLLRVRGGRIRPRNN